MVHVVRQYTERHRLSPGKLLLKVDFRNAFNEADRVAMMRFIARWFPEVLLFVMAAYGVPPYIIALGPEPRCDSATVAVTVRQYCHATVRQHCLATVRQCPRQLRQLRQ